MLDSVCLFQVAGVAAGPEYKSDSRFVVQRRALHQSTRSVVQYRDDLHLRVAPPVQGLPQEPYDVFVDCVGTIKTLGPGHQDTNVQRMLNYREREGETCGVKRELSRLQT